MLAGVSFDQDLKFEQKMRTNICPIKSLSRTKPAHHLAGQRVGTWYQGARRGPRQSQATPEMDGSSTVARFIQRFREAAPLSPDERRRGRDAMEGQFWYVGKWKLTPNAHRRVGCFYPSTSLHPVSVPISHSREIQALW